MNVPDDIWDKVANLTTIGLISLENMKEFYDVVNDVNLRNFLIENNAASNQLKFLTEVLNEPKLTKCPNCGHYNSNIECPIIRCDYCDHEWPVKTKSSDLVCNECYAFQTQQCNKKPPKDKKNSTDKTVNIGD
jgi:hypothetical protein